MILIKDGVEKDIRTPKVIERLKSQGWSEKGDQPQDDEKSAIKAELDKLGVKYHPNTGLEKLKEALEAAKAGK